MMPFNMSGLKKTHLLEDVMAIDQCVSLTAIRLMMSPVYHAPLRRCGMRSSIPYATGFASRASTALCSVGVTGLRRCPSVSTRRCDRNVDSEASAEAFPSSSMSMG